MAIEQQHTGFHDLHERHVDVERVEAAGEPVGPYCVHRELTYHVQLPAQRAQVFLISPILTWQAVPHLGQQPVGEQRNKDLEQRICLMRQGRRFAARQIETERDVEHVHQTRAHCLFLLVGRLRIDLWQDLEAASASCDHADCLSCPQKTMMVAEDVRTVDAAE